MQRASRKQFVGTPVTIGDFIRKRRLELGLLQSDVAKLFDTCEDTITNWENNKAQTLVRFYPSIIEFLQCYPFSTDTFGKIVQILRRSNGYTRKELGVIIGVNATTIRSWELEITTPQDKTITHVFDCLSS